MSPAGRIRVVVAKLGLDGHDRGAKNHPPRPGRRWHGGQLHRAAPTPRQIVETAIQEHADAVGLSILSGAHMTLVPRILEILCRQAAGEVVVTGGGTIPPDDAQRLEAAGVARVLTPGTATDDVVAFIRLAVTGPTQIVGR